TNAAFGQAKRVILPPSRQLRQRSRKGLSARPGGRCATKPTPRAAGASPITSAPRSSRVDSVIAISASVGIDRDEALCVGLGGQLLADLLERGVRERLARAERTQPRIRDASRRTRR